MFFVQLMWKGKVKVQVNNADTLPNFAKAVPMQPEQKKHAQATTSRTNEPGSTRPYIVSI